MKRSNTHTARGMSIGMLLGMSLGMSLGSTQGNISIGMTMGLALGMLLGMAIGRSVDNKINAQLEQEDYHVTEIQPQEDEGYLVTIESRDGTSQTIPVTAKKMKTQALNPGDSVYLDDKGKLEKIPMEAE